MSKVSPASLYRHSNSDRQVTSQRRSSYHTTHQHQQQQGTLDSSRHRYTHGRGGEHYYSELSGAIPCRDEEQHFSGRDEQVQGSRRNVVLSYAVKRGSSGRYEKRVVSNDGLDHVAQRAALILERQDEGAADAECSREEAWEVERASQRNQQQEEEEEGYAPTHRRANYGAVTPSKQYDIMDEQLGTECEPLQRCQQEEEGREMMLEGGQQGSGAQGGRNDEMDLCPIDCEEDQSEVSQATFAVLPEKFSSARQRDSPRTPRSAFRQPQQKQQQLFQTGGDVPQDPAAARPGGGGDWFASGGYRGHCASAEQQQQQQQQGGTRGGVKDGSGVSGVWRDHGDGKEGGWSGKGYPGGLQEQHVAAYVVMDKELVLDGAAAGGAAGLLQKHLSRFAEEASRKVRNCYEMTVMKLR